MPKGIYQRNHNDYLQEIKHQKNNYKRQIARIRKGLTPSIRWFNAVDLHNSIREILGEELTEKIIADTYALIAEEKGAKVKNE